MIKVEVIDVEINQAYIKELQSDAENAFELAADSVLTDLKKSQTMPMDTGHLQNVSTFLDKAGLKSGVVNIVSSTPYARRLYFNPQFNFRKDHNPLAGGRCFDPYLQGHKKQDLLRNAFEDHFYRQREGK